ncbi:MAG: T9SS type A sorting domain-containing protein [Bacteroidota bacterium]|nr:T9SS type A sorting domain-containing protein [Bacteroidota bacterium]
MKKTFKLLLALCSLLLSGTCIAQPGNFIVVSGGSFGTPGNYVRVGSYTVSGTIKFRYFDSIPGSSTAGVYASDKQGYATADSSILVFNPSNLTRSALLVSQTGLAGFSSLNRTQDNQLNPIFIHRNYGPKRIDIVKPSAVSMQLSVSAYSADVMRNRYDKDTFTLIVTQPGNYNDTFGKVSLFRDGTTFYKEIKLKDTLSKGIDKIVRIDAEKNIAYIICNGYARMLTLNYVTGKESYTAILNGISTSSGIFRSSNGIWGLNYSNGIERIVIDSDGKISTSSQPIFVNLPKYNGKTQFINKWAYDVKSNTYMATTTDYFSYGRGYVFDSTGKLLDDVNVGISPDALCAVIEEKTRSTSINSATKAVQLSLYPNPTSNYLNISLDNSVAGNITIYDNAGQTVQILALQNGHSLSINLDVNNFVAGMYHIVYSSTTSIGHAKFIKE